MRIGLLALALPLVVVISAHNTARAGAPVYIPPSALEPAPPPPPPQPEPQRYRLLVLDLKAVDVDKNTVATLQGFVTTNLSFYEELDVISGQDVKSMVELEADRATMGCSEDASCLADIADALGAQLVVFGNCGKLDSDLVINLNLFDSVKAQSLGRVVVQAPDAKQLAKKLKPKMHELVGRFYKAKGLTLAPLPQEKPEPVAVAAPGDPGPWPWVTVGTGVVLLAGGTAAAIFGYLPLAEFQAKRREVEALESQFAASSDPDVVNDAANRHTEMRNARTQWNNLGVYLFDAGIPAASIGAVATLGGVIWALSAPATAPAPTEDTEEKAPVAAGGAR